MVNLGWAHVCPDLLRIPRMYAHRRVLCPGLLGVWGDRRHMDRAERVAIAIATIGVDTMYKLAEYWQILFPDAHTHSHIQSHIKILENTYYT